jgi:GNAT superfamily N-acetyltransferase
MDIRPYLASDRQACLAIFDSNFDATRRPEFEHFLDHLEGPYFVMDHDGALVGCGGYSGETLVWGMIRRDFQKLGLGRFLLMYRLRKLEGVPMVRLTAPPHAGPFFEKQGFRGAGESPNGIEMVKKMNVCA